MLRFETVIISDLHLGALNARCQDVLEFLNSIQTERLIINGDLFQDPKLRLLRDCDIEVLEALRALQQEIRVDWLIGNHDPTERWLTALLDIEAQDELELDVDGRSYLVCHGHRWDRSLNWPTWLVGGAEAVYSACQWIDPSHRVAKFLKHKSKWFCRAVNALKRHAIQAAHQGGYDGVILGHTHVACDLMQDNVHYMNSGCWTEQPNGFVGIRDGVACTFQWRAGECVALAPLPEPMLNESLVLEDELVGAEEPLVATA